MITYKDSKVNGVAIHNNLVTRYHVMTLSIWVLIDSKRKVKVIHRGKNTYMSDTKRWLRVIIPV